MQYGNGRVASSRVEHACGMWQKQNTISNGNAENEKMEIAANAILCMPHYVADVSRGAEAVAKGCRVMNNVATFCQTGQAQQR